MRGFYFELAQPHVLLWPVIAVGFADEFWVGIGWLDLEFGWRSGDGGDLAMVDTAQGESK